MTTSLAATLRLRRDPALRSRAVRGDSQAFALLYERHHQALYRYARSLLQHDEDARDALQSAMTRAFVALQDEERDFEIRPWLFRIVHNEAISLVRRRRPTSDLDEARTIGRDDLEQTVETRERLGHLRRDLQDLPERQRAALVLRELSGLGHEEIAEVLESSPRAVKQTIYEARSALAEFAEGRAMECAEVQRQLSDGDGRVLRSRRTRAHLRSCRACGRFRAALAQRPGDLGALAPALPLAASAGILASVLPGAGGAVAGGSAIGGGAVAGSAAVAGGGLSLGAALGGGAKIALVLAAGATVAGGVAVTRHDGRTAPPPANQQRPASPPRPPVVATPVATHGTGAGASAATVEGRTRDRGAADDRRPPQATAAADPGTGRGHADPGRRGRDDRSDRPGAAGGASANASRNGRGSAGGNQAKRANGGARGSATAATKGAGRRPSSSRPATRERPPSPRKPTTRGARPAATGASPTTPSADRGSRGSGAAGRGASPAPPRADPASGGDRT